MFCRSVFAAYGRERSFLKQQQVAQKLYKQFGTENYYLWSIVATTLQVCVYVYLYVCVCEGMYACMYVCMYMCIHE